MFKLKASSSNVSTSSADKAETNNVVGNGKSETASNNTSSENGPDFGIETGKEAKEKKDKSSWVKTIGMRTLRMRRSTDSRSSRLSLPSFSSLDRPVKNKKKGKNEDKPDADFQYGKTSKDNLPDASNNEHVKVPTSGASSINESTPSMGVVSEEKDMHAVAGENSDKHDPARFLGDGLTFRGKLIGVLEVSGPRGDRICQEALADLKSCVKAAGEHKQKVTIHVALDGLRIRDEKTGDCLYHHQVHKISFIAQDLTDTRAFGYIFGSPDTGHRFFGIKTEKSASQVVIAMRDLFQVVFDLKKKEIEKAKQQLEMQQKFLATRAAEVAPSSKSEQKFSIAETYIEGACASGMLSSVPNRIAPEVDLLNLEVELTSLQEGLDSIHHNLSESIPFRGSTTSISSDPMNPMPKRSSVSSSNTNSTTPVPNAFGAISDPFGDSFDPFSETSGGHHHQPVNFQLGSSSKIRSSCGSALTSPFPSDPFAQVDPFPDPKFQPNSEFFNSDPFESPSGPFSFSFPAPEAANTAVVRKSSEGRLNRNVNGSSAVVQNSHNNSSGGTDPGLSKVKDGWTASFEDVINFVPESDGVAHSTSEKSFEPGMDKIFRDLDPLKTNRPKYNDDEHHKSLAAMKLSYDERHKISRKEQTCDAASMPNSFSTNFNPGKSGGYDLKTPISSFNTKSESPPDYSPPPPPRIPGSASPKSLSQSSNTHVPFILPPATSSPRLSKKKPPHILKQITIADPGSSPKMLPKLGARVGKQFTLDSSFHEEIPNLIAPPRPPHTITSTTLKSSSSLSSALPRPTSGSNDKSKKIPGVSGVPPEPPPRPMQSSSSITNQSMQLVSPPPLPPKKQSLGNTMSTPLGLKQSFSGNSKKPVSNTFSRASASESNTEIPLPLPSRKSHQPASATYSTSSGRYAIPESNLPISDSLSNSYESSKLSMEQALDQVASLSLRDLAVKLELPVDKLSSYTIQQLAHKLTEMKISSNKYAAKRELQDSHRYEKDRYGFDDDFSTASAPPKISVQKEAGYDRYAVFRELALEDASGFSIVNNVDSASLGNNSEDEEQSITLEKPFTSRESSSDRTLQADDITEPTHLQTASFATAMANTMDDVTDVNLSDDQDNDIGRFMMDDEDDIGLGLVKSEWATFESNFDDKFATTALVKAEDGNESPWDSDEEGVKVISPHYPDQGDQFDFKPFEKPVELIAPSSDVTRRKSFEESDGNRTRKISTPEERIIRSPPGHHGQFQRQSSGSSRHSERSGGGNIPDSVRSESRRNRRGSKDYERWEFDRSDRDGSGRYRETRERDYNRPDSRSSYSSIPKKYRNGDSEEDSSVRRGGKSSRGGSGTGPPGRSKNYDRDPAGEVDDEIEDDRSHASHHSNYSTGYSKRHRRYPSSKNHPHYSRTGTGRREKGSPERYSNQESDDDSHEDESYRKRDRENYAREREYYERHHRPRPNSGSSLGKRYSRESPRHSDPYYRRERRGRHRDEDDYGDSREFSDYSGEEDHPSHGHHHRRIRAKRSSYRGEREPRGHYYTNSPSELSESCPEGEKDLDRENSTREGGKKEEKRPNSGKNRERENRHLHSRESPEHYSSRRREKESSSRRRYQSDLALNTKSQDSPKLSVLNFDDEFGPSSLPPETTIKSRNSSVSSPLQQKQQEVLMEINIDASNEDTLFESTNSHFDNDFIEQEEVLNNGETNDESNKQIQENLLDCEDEAEPQQQDSIEVEEDNSAMGKSNGHDDSTTTDIFPPTNESKMFNYSGRRLESIKSEEEKSNDDSHSHNSEGLVHMKKSDSFNIFKHRNDDPFADDDFFA